MESRLNLEDLPLDKLAELAYALQIDYDPPLQESDRDNVIKEIMWISDHRDEILSREEDIKADRKRRRKIKGIMCNQEESFITGVNLLLLSDQQLIFLPFNHKGKKRYYCFTRSEAVEYLLEEGLNPYTNEELTEDDINYIKNELKDKPYPFIPVNSFLEEIEERLGDKKFEHKKVSYRGLIDQLVKIVEEKAGNFVNPGSLYDFSTNLTKENYNTFLRHDELRQAIEEEDNVIKSRDEAAAETLGYILNAYNVLKTSNYEKASKFIFNIALAMEEFLYMIKNNLSYQELLEEKGEEINGIKELHWKPDFLKEEYHDDGYLLARYYVNEYDQNHGPYKEYDEDGAFTIEVEYVNGKKQGSYKEYYGDGTPMIEVEYVNDNRQGPYREYYEDGTPMIEVDYVNGNREGPYREYYEDGNIKVKAKYVEDALNETYREYYRDGTPMIETQYVNGKEQGPYRKYYEDGTPMIETQYVNGKKQGPYRKYHKNGKLLEESNYVDDKIDGIYRAYYNNGNVYIEAEYSNGKQLKMVKS